MDTINENQAIIDITKQATKPVELSTDVWFVPDGADGGTVVDVDGFNPVPRNYRGVRHQFEDADSLLDYLHTHNDAGSAEIWAGLTPDRRSMRVQAVLDPAPAGPSQRVLTLAFTPTPRWEDWKRIDGKWFDQADFAEFLEDHAEDLAEPDAATMLEIAQSIRATIGTNVEKAIRLDNGETQLVYKEDIEGKAGRAGQLEIPQQIKIAVQPFTSSQTYALDAKFRYRLVNRELALSVKLLNADLMIERVFDGILDTIRAGAQDVPVYIGS